MSLAAGTRLGPYEIAAQIGVGGMGEVYRATDTNLKRQVAIKVLPAAVAGDVERLARFQREAEVLAALNQPNIAQIHGLEKSSGVIALVMELVEGEDLSQRIARGAIPVDEALPIAKQIAEALEAAHEQGIIHRDLKPANIKVRQDGTVKVLDFGLAKAMEPVGAMSLGMSQAPTITTPALMTAAGMVLGTAAYMSPEQARGTVVDKRADIWAFGCVLYEMLTGRRAFEGDHVADVLVTVLSKDVDWALLPPRTPAIIHRLLRRCLARDPRSRIADASTARLDIVEAVTSRDTTPEAPSPMPAPSRRTAIVVAALLALVAALAAAWGLGRDPSAAPMAVTRSLIDVAPAEQLRSAYPSDDQNTVLRPTRTAVTLSPDGSLLVFSGMSQGVHRLYVRRLDQLIATPIAGTEGADSPFFSADGRWIGFWAANELRKVPVDGGPALAICQTGPIFGASWGADGTIVFARSRNEGLWRVSAAGGTPDALTALGDGEYSHRLPHITPDGDAVVFTILGGGFEWDTGPRIAVRSLRTDAQQVVLPGGVDGRYVATGHLVYARLGTLMAVPFDIGRLAVGGDPVGLVDDVMQAAFGANAGTDTGAVQIALSDNGTLAYVRGGVFPDARQSVVMMDRQGRPAALPIPPRGYTTPRLAPGGRRLALGMDARERQVWLYDMERETLSQLAAAGERFGYPVWSPDGTALAFRATREGALNLFRRSLDAQGPGERVTTSQRNQSPVDWTPDGSALVFVEEQLGATFFDVRVVSLADRTVREVASLPTASELSAAVSPDGRWIAYTSNESGQNEVYVQSFQGRGERVQASSSGGIQPAWAHSGTELFYAQPEGGVASAVVQMMTVRVGSPDRLVLGRPVPLFRTTLDNAGPGRNYDVSPDDKSFVMLRKEGQPDTSVPTEIVLVQHWFEELKRLVPTN